MTVHERARQMLLAAGARRRADRDLAPAGRDFTGAKAVEAAGSRLAQRYGKVVQEYAKPPFKQTKNA
jgi:hypothetical protein